MQKYTRFVLFAGLLLVSGLTFVVAPFSSPAFAATTHQAKASPATTKPMVSIELGHVTHVYVNSMSAHTNASTPCRDDQGQSTWSILGVIDIYLTMKTHWCWNGVRVTYHSTSLVWGYTTDGYFDGWIPQNSPNSSFYCFDGVGNGDQCSANQEWAAEEFTTNHLGGKDCYLNEQQFEYGDFGNFYHNEWKSGNC